MTSSTYNNLNQLTGQSAGGPMRFEGELNEPATVTVDGNPAVVDGDDKFVGYADVTTGTNTVTIVATDASSNVTTHDYEVTVSGGATRTLVYDLNGNLTDNDAGVEYSWDAANRLVKIDDGTDETEFVYDGLGRRVAEKLNSTVIKRWLWAPGSNQPIEERNDDGDVVVKHYYAQGVHVPAASSPVDKLFYTYDHLGSVRELTDDNETVLARYEYDSYGRRTKLTGAGDADFGYTGHYQHSSGLILTWYRAYDPELGRWLSRDSLKNSETLQGPNLYAYVSNNPINLIDPVGRFGWKGITGIVLGIAGGYALAHGAITLGLGLITAGAILEIWEAYDDLGPGGTVDQLEDVVSGIYKDSDRDGFPDKDDPAPNDPKCPLINPEPDMPDSQPDESDFSAPKP